MNNTRHLAALALALILTTKAGLAAPVRMLQRLPPPVRETVRAYLNPGQLESADLSSDDNGRPVYDVTINTEGKSRDFTIAPDGSVLDMQVFMGELPPEVQRSISAQAGDAPIETITKSTENGDVSYDVEVNKDGATMDFSVDAKGQLTSAEIPLSAAPTAVQETIRAKLEGATLGTVTRNIDEEVTNYGVQMTKDGRKREFTVAADGRFLGFRVHLADIPVAVKSTVLAQLKNAQIDDIHSTVEDGQTVFEVELNQGGKSRDLTVANDGQIVDQEVFLEETPHGVQDAIQAQQHDARIASITRTEGKDGATFEVEFNDGGKERSVTISAAGAVSATEEPVLLADVPSPVQTAIKARAEALSRISKKTQKEAVTYEVELIRAGDVKTISLTGGGQPARTEAESH